MVEIGALKHATEHLSTASGSMVVDGPADALLHVRFRSSRRGRTRSLMPTSGMKAVALRLHGSSGWESVVGRSRTLRAEHGG